MTTTTTITATATATFLSESRATDQFPIPKPRRYIISSKGWSSIGQTSPTKSSFKLIPLLRCSSSPTSTSVVEEETPPPPSDGIHVQSDSTGSHDSDFLPPTRGCKACGREELEKGCNGEGRIQGGIATVPGFGWWPIKAYRPCPGFVASGGRYRRQGQSMDEVAFGRGERGTSMRTNDAAQSSKKKQGPRRIKR